MSDNRHNHHYRYHHHPPSESKRRKRNRRTSEPSSTIIVRNLVNEVTEEHLFNAVESQYQLQPVNVRVMRDMTGFTKGFAFIEFSSIDGATELLDRSKRLLTTRVKRFSNIGRGGATAQDDEELIEMQLDFAEDKKHHHHHQGRDDQYGAPPKRDHVYRDWLCDKCGEHNFGHREKCFSCGEVRSEHVQEIEVPKAMAAHFLPSENQEPSTELIVRGLDPSTTEDTVFRYFSTIVPVQRVRVIKDKASGLSRRFAFVKFATLDVARYIYDMCKQQQSIATAALSTPSHESTVDRCAGIVIDGCSVTVDYANSRSRESAEMNHETEALQIAQWQSAYDYNYRTQQQMRGADIATQATGTPATEEYLATLRSCGFDSYDAKTGYYYNADLNYFFDPKTCYYYDNNHEMWLRYDTEQQTYIPVSGSTGGIAATHMPTPQSAENEQIESSISHVQTVADGTGNNVQDEQETREPRTNLNTTEEYPKGPPHQISDHITPNTESASPTETVKLDAEQQISAEATNLISSVLGIAAPSDPIPSQTTEDEVKEMKKKRKTKKKDDVVIMAMVGKHKSSKNIMRWNKKNQEIRSDVAAEEKKRQLERQQRILEKQQRQQQQQEQQQRYQQQQALSQPSSLSDQQQQPTFQSFSIGNPRANPSNPPQRVAAASETTVSSVTTIGKGFVPNPNFKKAMRALSELQYPAASRSTTTTTASTTSYYGSAKTITTLKKRKQDEMEQVDKEPESLIDDEENIGNRLLKKMGWSGGGLGKNEDGRQENIAVQQRDRSGLGFSDPLIPDNRTPIRVDISPGDTYLDIARKKARARYEQTLRNEQHKK